jgi:hypothetical protein
LIDISSTDGPISRQARGFADTYRAGQYDGIDDIYRSSMTPWNTVFGGADYVFTGRLQSAALHERAIGGVFETYAGSAITATSKLRFNKRPPVSRDRRPSLWAAE